MMKWVLVSLSALVGVALIVAGGVLGWGVFPGIVNDQIKESVVLKNGTDQWERFENFPIDLLFKVYFFEVLNPQEAIQGEKIKIKEKGPYVYRESKNKEDIQIINDTIRYHERQLYAFDQIESGNLTEEDEVTILNSAYIGAMQIFESIAPTMLENLNNGFKYMFNDQSIFMKVKVKDVLFDAIKICEPAKINAIKPKSAKIKTNMLCTFLRGKVSGIKNMRRDPKDGKTLLFSFFHHKNDTFDGYYSVNSGTENVENLAEIEEWNDSNETTYWDGLPCSKVRGRDSLIYPPYMTIEQGQDIFNTDICRTVTLSFEKDIQYRGASGYRYLLNKSTLKSADKYHENACYCIKKSKGIENKTSSCFFDGVMDLYTCYGAPLVLSYPHFMWADSVYQNSVDGCKPDEEKHMTYVDVEPNTGTPMRGSKRVQFNMFVRPVQNITDTQNFQPTIVPMIWIDEGVEMDDKTYNVLYDSFISKTHLITGVIWGLVGVGAAIVLVSLGITIWMRRSQTTVV